MRTNLMDVTFLVIVKFDSIERLENTIHLVEYLDRHFETNIVVREYACWNNGVLQKILSKKIHYQFIKDLDPILHRTKYLNSMIDQVQTEYVSVWDVDVIISKEQIVKAIDYLRNGTDVVYPYNCFYDTTDYIRHLYLEHSCDIKILNSCIKSIVR